MRKGLALLVGLLLLAPLVSYAFAAENQHQQVFTVVFQGESIPADAAAMVEAAGGRVVGVVPQIGVMQVAGPGALIERVGAQAGVAAVGPSLVRHLSVVQQAGFTIRKGAVGSLAAGTLNAAYQWDIRQVTEGGSSYRISQGSHQTVVAVIDSGIDTDHPDLAANLLGGRNFVPDGPKGQVVPGDIEDRHGHGTHVAGAIAANGLALGVAPQIGIRAYRVIGQDGSGLNYWITAAIVAAVHDGADVLSLSLGGYDVMAWGTWTDPETGIAYPFKDVADFVAYKRAVSYAVKQGVVVVAAAGNDHTDITNPHAVTAMMNQAYGPEGFQVQGATRVVPATLPGVVTVAATGPDRSLGSYSNYGAAIDVAAPGGDAPRYPNGDWYTDLCFSTVLDGGYGWMGGTSMATPKVSAVAGLIIDQARQKGENLTPAQVQQELGQTAVDLGPTGNDPFFGHGLVDAYRALGGK